MQRDGKIQPPCGKCCPDRQVGCSAVCEKWAAYVRERDAEYSHRAIMAGVKAAISDGYRRMGGTR